MFTSDAGKVMFTILGAIEEFGNNLVQLLSVLGVRDEVVQGVADTLAAAQGVGGEAVEMRTKTWSIRMSTPFILLGTSSILTRICWSD